MSLIDAQQVEQVARLARISLSDEQLDQLGRQLGQILEYVGQLQTVDVPEGIEPFFGLEDVANASRPDHLQPGLDREQVLRNAPEDDGEYYLVPPVFK